MKNISKLIENPRFKMTKASELVSEGFKTEWLIRDVIPKSQVGMIYGPSGCGKSFLALDLGYSIARGVPWGGFKAKQGKVIYVAYEGRGGLPMRIKAYEAEHEITADNNPPIFLLESTPNIMKPDEVKTLIDTINNEGGVSMIIFDSLSSCIIGANENSSEDMGLVINHCKYIEKETGATVLLVRHSWFGTFDFQIEVIRDNRNKRSFRLNKYRYAPAETVEYGFKLGIVIVGKDNSGDEPTSCVVVHADIKPKRVVNKTRKFSLK